MRSHRLTRRVLLAPALGLGLAVAVAACSSGSSTPAASPSPRTPVASPSVTPGGTALTGTAATIKTNWQTFFSGQTDAAKKISLLQNGQTFAPYINSQASSSLSKSAAAQVSNVTGITSSSATVHYSILLGGTPALSGQTGTAVLQNGTWKVGDVSFCKLLTLENAGKAPSVCTSAG